MGDGGLITVTVAQVFLSQEASPLALAIAERVIEHGLMLSVMWDFMPCCICLCLFSGTLTMLHA